MEKDHLSRKLAVLLHTDVVGSTSLVQQNETLAHERIQDTFRRLSEIIGNYGGVALEIRGDALVAEFSKASDAVSASLDFQAANSTQNEQLSDDILPVLRIGIAMGEVVVADNTVTGEGIVLAQRLEKLAKPGGVCIQGAAYDTLPKRLPFEYENLGEQQVKGFDEPVRVYAVSLRPGGVIPESESLAQPEAGAFELSEKPSIAVLPFTNMSDHPEQEYFSDGITEDIITGLSRFRELFVIARGSSFAFKGQSVDVTEAAEKLGARYVLEGSVRKVGDRVRITAQLSDATTRNHLWVESYDRVLEDVFAVQDDVAQKIISTLAVRLEEESRERAMRKSATNLSAYDCYLRGKHCFPDWKGSKENILQARDMFEKALELDPDYALAYSGLAETYLAECWTSWTPNHDAAAERTFECARKAVELDNRDSHAHIMLACAYFYVMGNFELAEIEIQKALDLNPNDYWNYCLKTEFSMCSGDFEESIYCGNEAIHRNPFLPDSCLHGMGFSEYFAQRYEKAIKTFARLSEPGADVQACIAACFAQLGRIEDAATAAAKFHDGTKAELSNQGWDAKGWQEYWTSQFTFKNPEQLSHLIDGLRKAGLIEKLPD